MGHTLAHANDSSDRHSAFRTLAAMQFLAAVAIMIRHYACFLEGQYPIVAEHLGRINFVEFFFACSGFQLVQGYRDRLINIGDFLARRLKRIYPLHAITTLFFGVIIVARLLGLYPPRSAGEYRLSDILYSLSLTQAWGLMNRLSLNYPSWYLSAQFAAYLLFIPALECLRRFAAWPLVAAIIISLALLEWRGADPNLGHWTEWTYHYGVARAVPTFLAGMLLGWYFDAIKNKITSFAPAYLVMACSIVGMVGGLSPTVSYAFLQVALVPLLAAPEANGAKGILTASHLQRLAPLSFCLYLLHVPVATIVIGFVFRDLLQKPAVVVLLPATMIVAIAAAHFTNIVLTKWPLSGPNRLNASRTVSN